MIGARYGFLIFPELRDREHPSSFTSIAPMIG